MIDADRYFWRHGICCVLTVNDAGIWWGHLGLHPTHPLAGSGFITRCSVNLARVAMPPTLPQKLLSRAWVGFEGGYSQEKTLKLLKDSADALRHEEPIPL